MKKLWLPAVLAALTGCGSLPTFPGMTGEKTSTETTTATSALYRIMGLEDPGTGSTEDSVHQPLAEQPSVDPVQGEPLAPPAPGATPSSDATRAPRGHELLFLLLDTDGNGKIQAAELKSAIQSRKAEVSDQAIADLFKKLDRNADGGVDSSELAPPRGRDSRGGKMRGGEERSRDGGTSRGRRPMGPPSHGRGHDHER